MSPNLQVADSVMAELNAATFSQLMTATRSYLPRMELADLKTLKVTVVLSSVAVASASRSQAQRDVPIDVAVQEKLGQEQNEALDPLLALAEEIAEHFRAERLDSLPGALRVKTEFKPISASEHIEPLQTFTSAPALTFRVIE